MTAPADLGHAIGGTIALSWLDAEAAADELAGLGFTAAEVHLRQLAPALEGVAAGEAHAVAFGRLLLDRGLLPSSLNAAGAPGFEPISGPWDAAVDVLAAQLRIAKAIGATRLICWDGRADNREQAAGAPGRLGQAVVEARRRSRLDDPPAISVELHPFTFALAFDLLDETAAALHAVDAGFCIDFCHFGVALGPDFTDRLTPELLEATNHVHLADSDCITSELHFPLGEGVLDLQSLLVKFSGRPVPVAWDLFAWPAARQAMKDGFDRYRQIVTPQMTKPEVLS